MSTKSLQLLIVIVRPQEQARARRRQGVLTELSLRDENRLFDHTRGVSSNNGRQGFVPGFRDSVTGDLAVSRFADGSPAPIHLLDGLPEAWIADRDEQGHVTRTQPGLVSGFIRDGRFYTREEVMRVAAN